MPGALLAATAASYAKGQEVTKDASSETKEKQRAMRAALARHQADLNQQKTNDAQKGFLA